MEREEIIRVLRSAAASFAREAAELEEFADTSEAQSDAGGEPVADDGTWDAEDDHPVAAAEESALHVYSP